jgi:hypothetical protein
MTTIRSASARRRQLYLAAAGDDASAKTCNRGQSNRHVGPVGDRVGYVNFPDNVGGHATLRVG